jgi:hypothetical protein
MAYGTSPPTQTTDEAGDGIEITAPRARQAYRGRRVLWILLASLAAVIVAFVIAFATNPTTPVAHKGGNGQTRDPAAAQSFSTHAPAPKTPG